jgi:hypothetical protein
LVEKRTLTIALLATLTWGLIATGSVTYYYLEQIRYHEQLSKKQDLLNQLKENYEFYVAKRNLMSGEYSKLFGEYQWFAGEDYSPLITGYNKLLSNLRGNYTLVLNKFSEINATYNDLLSKVQSLKNENVTKEEFGSLLNDFYKLFTTLAMKEIEEFLGETATIHVNICIDYGNGTVNWYNNTPASLGTTLFNMTTQLAKVNYSYWPTMEPGHILVNSINNYTEGYWVWYYWNENINDWNWGPVGCDAWVLEDNGIYKWSCISY